MIKKILVFGAGYVGSSLSVLLAEYFQVVLVDVDQAKVKKIENKQAPINEPLIQELLNEKSLNLSATICYQEDLATSDLVILALPTNYDEVVNFFDTSILEKVLNDINTSDSNATVVIKSTIPIGFTKKVSNAFPKLSIVFVPEFLREGCAIQDNLYPSRIVIGSMQEKASAIAEVFLKIAKNIPEVLYMSSNEAEAVKLFANTYLAMRVSFFNELDSFSLKHGLSTKNIIDGVSSDNRIGKGYNNPSFGYGGYCLPKDTKQLLSNYATIPQAMFGAVVESNILRKEFITSIILEKKPKLVGIFRLVMKKGSDNFRESAIFAVMEFLKASGTELLVYEPMLDEIDANFEVTHDLESFKKNSDLILANRMDKALLNVSDKVFTRDVYGEN
jgi:UDPglucose 6-dehydrogenase